MGGRPQSRRQTVYADFPTRQALLDAIFERATVEFTAAFDGAGLDERLPRTPR